VLVDVRIPLLQFLGRMALVAAQLGDQRDHAGVDAGHQLIGSLSPVVEHQQFTGAAGHVRHARALLVEDQVQTGAQTVPALLERLDARVAAADLKRAGAGGEGGIPKEAQCCQGWIFWIASELAEPCGEKTAPRGENATRSQLARSVAPL
jgi:hypothetical protein